MEIDHAFCIFYLENGPIFGPFSLNSFFYIKKVAASGKDAQRPRFFFAKIQGKRKTSYDALRLMF